MYGWETEKYRTGRKEGKKKQWKTYMCEGKMGLQME